MSGDVVVLGDGVNERVAARHLRAAGMRVRIVREAAASPDPWQRGWMPPVIARELGLAPRGANDLESRPWLTVALPQGGRLELYSEVQRTADAIRKLSTHDAARWPVFCERMHAIGRILELLYLAPPPDPMTGTFTRLASFARAGLRAHRLGRQAIEDTLRVIPMSIADLLDDWLENDALKGALGAAGVVDLCRGPRSGGTAFNFLHQHVGLPAGLFRPALVDISDVLAIDREVEIVDAKVAQIVVRDRRVASVAFSNGHEIAAGAVLSGLHPKRTLLELVDTGLIDPDLVRAVRHIRSRGVVAVLDLLLDRAPPFVNLAIAQSLNHLEHAYDDAKYGRVSDDPYIEAHYAGTDAEGHRRVRVRMQYAPYALREGRWGDEKREMFTRIMFDKLGESMRGLSDIIVEQRFYSPRDLETGCGYPEGQPQYAEIALDQVLWMRPVPELAQYATPIAGLYLCGPAMHPGAHVLGASGLFAAQALLRNFRSAS